MSWKGPVGGVDYPRTYQEFGQWFGDEASCRAYLARLRWPAGFSCPRCGGDDFWVTGRGLWMCPGCGLKTSVTAGTIFHRSHTPLSTWFAAVWLVTSQKNGVSAQGLQDVLGFGSYETAWTWLHKLRLVRRSLVFSPRSRSDLSWKTTGILAAKSDGEDVPFLWPADWNCSSMPAAVLLTSGNPSDFLPGCTRRS